MPQPAFWLPRQPWQLPNFVADSVSDGILADHTGDFERATTYFERAQRLNPGDWNYHRQEWSFHPNAGRKWLEKFQLLDTPYYPTLDIKPEPKPKEKLR